MVALLAVGAALSMRSATVSPIVTPIKYFFGDPVIMVSIDGKPPVEFGLTMSTRHSIVTTIDDSGPSRKLTIDGKSIGIVNLESPPAGLHPVLNAMGLGVLNGLAIGIDYARDEITLWPGGNLGADAAKAWILKSPKWSGDATVFTQAISRRADVAPVIPITVGGKQSVMLLRLGQQGSSFASGAEPAGAVPVEYGPGGNQVLLTDVGLGETTLPWVLYFRGVSYDPRKEIDPSIVGTFTTDNLLARRVIIDLPANEMYAESLPADAKLSMFLSEWFQLPLDVSGEKMTIREMPGSRFYPQLQPIYESEVLEIMGQPAQQIIDAARQRSSAQVTYLKLLFERVWQGFKVKFKKPNGEVLEATMRPPK